jgi:hypothetical protein
MLYVTDMIKCHNMPIAGCGRRLNRPPKLRVAALEFMFLILLCSMYVSPVTGALRKKVYRIGFPFDPQAFIDKEGHVADVYSPLIEYLTETVGSQFEPKITFERVNLYFDGMTLKQALDKQHLDFYVGSAMETVCNEEIYGTNTIGTISRRNSDVSPEMTGTL